MNENEIKYKVTTTIEPGDARIKQETETLFNGLWQKVSTQIYDLQDRGFRNALVDLGWTPPKER